MKLVPITNPSEELVGCTPNNLNDPSCLTVVFNVLTNELHCYTPMIPYVKRSAIKNNTSYQLFLRTTNGNAFTDITCSNSNLCIVNYSKDLTPSIVSISPQYFYFGQHIQFRIIPITFKKLNFKFSLSESIPSSPVSSKCFSSSSNFRFLFTPDSLISIPQLNKSVV